MTITNHWIDFAIRELIPGGEPMPVRRCLVIHFTAGATAKSSINFWRTTAAKGASAHVVIDRNGTIYQCRPFSRTCGHAGVSRWIDPNTGIKYTGLNSCSIGIELANAGNDDGALAWARKRDGFGSVKVKHRNGGETHEWETYQVPQLLACCEVSRLLCEEYYLDDITGHDCIAPERRNDPGPAFPMLHLREHCGFLGLPRVRYK